MISDIKHSYSFSVSVLVSSFLTTASSQTSPSGFERVQVEGEFDEEWLVWVEARVTFKNELLGRSVLRIKVTFFGFILAFLMKGLVFGDVFFAFRIVCSFLALLV